VAAATNGSDSLSLFLSLSLSRARAIHYDFMPTEERGVGTGGEGWPSQRGESFMGDYEMSRRAREREILSHL